MSVKNAVNLGWFTAFFGSLTDLVNKFVKLKITCIYVNIATYTHDIYNINIVKNILGNHVGDSFLWVYLSIIT